MQRIPDIGISVAYEPENCSPIVDIIIIHGLQGHPYKTWAYTKVLKPPTSPAPSRPEASDDGKDRNKNLLRRVVPRLTRKSSEKVVLEAKTGPALAKPAKSSSGKFKSVFWPADLLPRECPNSRILVYGYDTKITKYMNCATNKNSVFSHSKDLLFALCRERMLDRPLIFIAHSLGGIVVKEMLARSSASTETELKNVVDSTAAVIFLGTPHRGSPDLAALGEWVRSVVSTLRMGTTSAILDALSLKTSDLERAQEEFSGLWQKYDFRVKTFQEGLGLAGVNLGVLGNKVVPDYSSLIGDQREHAETIEANHMGMCRFSGADDPNYHKVAGELRSIYLSIEKLNVQKVHQSGRIQRRASMRSAASSVKMLDKTNGDKLDEAEKACLRSLWFPKIDARPQNLEKPAEQTCLWLFIHEAYQDWFNSRNRDKHYGLLWLKGKPGAGKSILMKEAFRRAALGQAESDYWTAAFFFNGKGDELEHSPIGLFRSLLHQLLPRHREHLRGFSKIWEEKKLCWGDHGVTAAPWREAELRSFFQSAFAQQPAKRMLIFIDALDECDSKSIPSQAYFWREITKSAYAAGVHINVCLSSRHFPNVTVSDCPEIVVENHNSHDIATYVEQKFKLGIATEEPQWELLRDKVLGKSAGVFLWVVLVVDAVLRKWDEGKSMRYLLKQLDVIPEALETLFSQMFGSLNPEARQLTVRLFQWAILAVNPLRLHEWHHILAFIRQLTPSSLHEWRLSDDFTENDDQLERQIRSVSKGLIEVRIRADEAQDVDFETISVCAGAGSLDLEHGEARIVQVIHESVREFFLRSNGFSILDPSLESNPIGDGHISIMATCLDYLNIAELDALVQERNRAEHREKAKPRGKEPPMTKFIMSLGASSSSSSLSSFDIALNMAKNNNRSGAPPDLTPALHGPDLHATVRSQSPGSCGERHYYDDSRPSPSRRRRGRRAEETSVFETLQKPSDSAAHIDITRWRTTIQFVAGQISLNESARNSTTHLSLSVTGQSQVLEDYPALLSYATFKLFTHAQLAEEEGADPSPITDRLKENETWARWVTLREDVAQAIELLQYATDQGLSTWVSKISDKGYSREGSDCYESRYKSLRRRGSIASFSSAGSHFSELGETLFTQSAPDEALLRKMQHGDPVSPYAASRSLSPSRRGSLSRPHHQRGLSENGPPHSRKMSADSVLYSQQNSVSGRLPGVFICDCCPGKPKKFDSEEELRLHELEKQYTCQYCSNRFENKNELERHRNSLHLRRQSWSCAGLAGVRAAFYPSLTHARADVCGYCGEEFANPANWDARSMHLNHVHKFGECCQAKKFFRADHFRQHLKHSHAATSGKWTNMLENACRKDEPPFKDRVGSIGSVAGSSTVALLAPEPGVIEVHDKL